MAETCIVCLGDLKSDLTGSPPAEDVVSSEVKLDVDNGTAAGKLPANTNDHTVAPVEASLAVEDECIAHLLPCGHNLHNECLKPWVERANSCPICRKNFNEVELMESIGAPVIDSYAVEDKQQVADLDTSMIVDEDLLEPSYEPCVVCEDFGDEEHLLLCDSCEQPCHVFCAGLDEAPSGAWYCQTCVEDPFLMAQQATTRQRNANSISRATRRQRAARSNRQRNDPWAQVWQQVWSRTGLDLDFPFDEEVSERRNSGLQERELAYWQRRVDAARGQGSAERFREQAAALLRPTRPPPPPPESQDEIRAWNAFEKAREAAVPATSRRKRKSVTSSPKETEPEPEPERQLKRPRTRRVLQTAGPSHTNGAEPSAGAGAAANGNGNGVGPSARRDSRNQNGPESGPNFLQSLLKEVEVSTSMNEANPQRISTDQPTGENAFLQASSPVGSPVDSNAGTPRAMTPPPLSLNRPTSPPLSSTIVPVYQMSPGFAPFSPSEDCRMDSGDNSSGAEGVERRMRRHQVRSDQATLASPPRSKDASPTRANMSYSTKAEIQRMVKAVLKPLYAQKTVNTEEYTDINKNVSRMMYDRVGDANNLADEATRDRWQQVATDEVNNAVQALKNRKILRSSPDVGSS
ncbi:hypothetical protein K490DRAFT_47118 [Saccharata proteae CBS 121410]|uniref:PHD and RING finger domain-containing protein n=1 Tax=Saccharata proteae CBS 121410 TaxID=1314787 RepID=A0A9P4LUU6_9PEZI|nr:hypothetical protein K490DRAFT_47118 [Saccharata proteae CBS 121410]